MHSLFNKKNLIFSLLILIILGVSFSIYSYIKLPTSLEKDLITSGKVGELVKADFLNSDTLNLQKNQNNYAVRDYLTQGPIIKTKEEEKPKNELNIEFPKNYQEPIQIKLDEQRFITIKDNSSNSYTDKTLVKESQTILDDFTNQEKDIQDRYLKYQSKDSRKSIYYAYQKETKERTIKNWTIYTKKDEEKEEKESYTISNAKLKKNNQGEIEVFYFGEQQLKNQEIIENVDTDLLSRAQRTLQAETGNDILNSDNYTPDFIIPKPYYLNQQGERVDLDWNLNQDSNTIEISFTPKKEDYPIALDPTFQFVAPGVSGSGVVMDNVAASVDYFGLATMIADLNADGKDDLVVGYGSNLGGVYIFYGNVSSGYSGGADVVISGLTSFGYLGRALASADLNGDSRVDLVVGAFGNATVYVFYNDGNYPTTTAGADIAISGLSLYTYFGSAIAVGDLNSDGKMDLAVGESNAGTNAGNAYIFYNDGSIPLTAATADVKITPEGSNNTLGSEMTCGDFNNDGRTDLSIVAGYYNNNQGRVYIFYNDGTIPTTAGGADVIITGAAQGDYFGVSVVAIDANYDTKDDLIIGAKSAGGSGRVYVFYNDGTYPTTAGGADIAIVGDNGFFGYKLVGGDMNNDGRTDLIVGAYSHTTDTGKVYIFYNDGTYPAGATTADVIITGETTTSYFSYGLAVGDLNNDTKSDLIVGAHGHSANLGRVYILNNDGSYPASAADADAKIIVRNVAVGTNFSSVMTSGDFDADGDIDLAVGDYTVTTNTGQVYIFYNDGTIAPRSAGADVIITGETTANYFGTSLTTGDFNGDSKTDLAVGAYGNATNTGKAYIFYNDGSYTSLAASADIIIAGETTNNYFSRSLGAGDFNNDSKDDLVVGADGNATNTGKVYVFYTDGSIPAAASADIVITGEATGNYFGYYLTVVDYNGDIRKDIVTSAYAHTTNTGKVYLFYNDGTVPTTAATADSIITGEATNNYFGAALGAADFNNDNKLDLIIGAYGYNTNQGKIYVFYTDGSIPTLAGGADIKITGLASSYFGWSISTGDFNEDDKADLIVGAKNSSAYFSNAGCVYVFYNDGKLVSYAPEADIVISGEATNNYFGYATVTGDFNADGNGDVAIGAIGYNTNVGRVYIYYSDMWQMGEVGSVNNDYYNKTGLGSQVAVGDMNNDGKDDLIVGSGTYNTNTGRVYVFYNDDSISTTPDGADLIITGEATGNYFGDLLRVDDLDGNGKDDLIVGAVGYSSSYGRLYIFYNYGTISNSISAAQTITGTATEAIGSDDIVTGDFNYDGKIDIVTSKSAYNSNQGRVYIFYNDGSIPATSTDADVKIVGEVQGNYFSYSLVAGDFNDDGRDDLAVGSFNYNSAQGRAYIFYNDGTIPTTAGSADVIIIGESSSNFGMGLTSGDLNNDEKTDLIICGNIAVANAGKLYAFYTDGTNNFGTVACSGSNPTTCNSVNADVVITGDSVNMGTAPIVADFNNDGSNDVAVTSYGYNSYMGKVHIFYNDGSIPTSATNADVTILGENIGDYFGKKIAAGDLNNDGKTDLITVSATYNSSQGRVYIFYNDGAYPAVASSAEFIISGELTTNPLATYFGCDVAKGDLNQDGKDDLIVGAYGYNTNAGRAYIFYGKANFQTDSDAADVVINGEASSYFGRAFYVGDFNNDSKSDLIVGAFNDANIAGKAYAFYADGTDNYGTVACTGSSPVVCQAVNADHKITGEATSGFGSSFTMADFNYDGKNDLAVGASWYSGQTGRVYIFYQDASIPTTAASANVTITGGNGGYYFGYVTNGDMNNDGRVDLIASAHGYNSSQGRVYVFYNDGSYSAPDVTITGEPSGTTYFGYDMTMLDLNNDNRVDLVASGSGGTSKAYVFYNDGTIPTTAASADIIINTKSGITSYGNNTRGDVNNDGTDDLILSGVKYLSFFYNDGSIPNSAVAADAEVYGDSSTGSFGSNNKGMQVVVGDFNDDNISEIAVGDRTYGTTIGKVYLLNFDRVVEEVIKDVQINSDITIESDGVSIFQ